MSGMLNRYVQEPIWPNQHKSHIAWEASVSEAADPADVSCREISFGVNELFFDGWVQKRFG